MWPFNFCLISLLVSRSCPPFAFFLSVILSILCIGFFFFSSENCLLSPEFSVWHLKVICGSWLVNFLSGKFSLLVFWLKSLTSKYILLFLANSYKCPPFFSFLFPSALQCPPEQCSAGMALPKLTLSQTVPCCLHSSEWWRTWCVLQPSPLKSRSFPKVHPRRGYPRSCCQEGAQISAEARGNWGVAGAGALALEKWGEGCRGHWVHRQGADISGESAGDVAGVRQEGLGLTVYHRGCHQLGFCLGDRVTCPIPPSSQSPALNPFSFHQKYQK